MRRLLRNSFILKGFLSKPSTPSFASDVLKLVGGTALAQALAVLASPIITRLYGPEAFGVAALFTSITGIIGVIACLRYEMAIMIPDKEGDAANLLGLSLLISAAMSILLVPVLWMGKGLLLLLLDAPELGPYIWLIPPVVFLTGTFLSLNYWNSRTKRFGRLSMARINASFTTTGTQIGAGLAGYPTGGSLIWAGILGSLVPNLVLGGQIWRDDYKILLENINFKSMWAGLVRYKRFLIFDTWSVLLNNLSSQLPVLILSSFFTSSIIGYYALAYNVLALPMNLIGSSIGQVFFQRAAKAKHEGNLGILVENVTSVLTLISIYPIFLLFLFGEELFSIVFGAQWGEAGLYAEILAPWIFLVFTTSPISALFSVLEKQPNSLLINIILVLTRAGSLILGGVLGNVYVGLILFSLVGCFMNIIALSWLMNKSGASIMRLSVSVMCSLTYCIPIFIFSGLVELLKIGQDYIIVYCAITSTIYYLIISKKVINLALPRNLS